MASSTRFSAEKSSHISLEILESDGDTLLLIFLVRSRERVLCLFYSSGNAITRVFYLRVVLIFQSFCGMSTTPPHLHPPNTGADTV
jgi:hypothetical protein